MYVYEELLLISEASVISVSCNLFCYFCDRFRALMYANVNTFFSAFGYNNDVPFCQVVTTLI